MTSPSYTLLYLPFEIREQIYRLIFSAPLVIGVRISARCDFRGELNFCINRYGILNTCKQIRAEASYLLNVIMFLRSSIRGRAIGSLEKDENKDLYPMLSSFIREHVTEIIVQGFEGCIDRCFSLSYFPNLQKISSGIVEGLGARYKRHGTHRRAQIAPGMAFAACITVSDLDEEPVDWVAVRNGSFDDRLGSSFYKLARDEGYCAYMRFEPPVSAYHRTMLRYSSLQMDECGCPEEVNRYQLVVIRDKDGGIVERSKLFNLEEGEERMSIIKTVAWATNYSSQDYDHESLRKQDPKYRETQYGNYHLARCKRYAQAEEEVCEHEVAAHSTLPFNQRVFLPEMSS